jgi:glycosyltransferase involved in cell wall biosynthesis
MRAGTPVVAAAGAVPAVLRPHARTFAADDAAALVKLLVALLDDPAAARAAGRTARTATAHLTWERTTRLTAELYRQLAA